MKTRHCLLAVLPLAVACGHTTPAGPSPGITPEGLVLTALVVPDEILPGDEATILVSLTNPTSRTIALDFGSSCQLLYAVEDADGRPAPVEGGGFACLTVLTTLTLPPDETKEVTFRWSGQEYLSPPPRYQDLPPGVYRFYGVLANASVRSAPVTLRLLSRS
jgi:hypothetical protein